MKPTPFLVPVLLWCLALPAPGQEPAAPKEQAQLVADAGSLELRDPEVQRLLKAIYFAFGPAGIAGGASQGEIAFGRIAARSDATRFFSMVFDQGAAPARCYALVALRELSPELFRTAMAAMRESAPKNIVTINGCLISFIASDELLTAIEKGTYAADFKRCQEKARAKP